MLIKSNSCDLNMKTLLLMVLRPQNVKKLCSYITKKCMQDRLKR